MQATAALHSANLAAQRRPTACSSLSWAPVAHQLRGRRQAGSSGRGTAAAPCASAAEGLPAGEPLAGGAATAAAAAAAPPGRKFVFAVDGKPECEEALRWAVANIFSKGRRCGRQGTTAGPGAVLLRLWLCWGGCTAASRPSNPKLHVWMPARLSGVPGCRCTRLFQAPCHAACQEQLLPFSVALIEPVHCCLPTLQATPSTLHTACQTHAPLPPLWAPPLRPPSGPPPAMSSGAPPLEGPESRGAAQPADLLVHGLGVCAAWRAAHLGLGNDTGV